MVSKSARQQVLETASSIEGGIKAVEQLIRRKQKLRELFYGEDITAAGVVKALYIMESRCRRK